VLPSHNPECDESPTINCFWNWMKGIIVSNATKTIGKFIINAHIQDNTMNTCCNAGWLPFLSLVQMEGISHIPWENLYNQ
jgi:hypothetical protein